MTGGRYAFAIDAQGRSGACRARDGRRRSRRRPVKWARSGDALTLDPHAQNEGPTHNLLQQIYEPLILRDLTGKLLPDAGAVLEGHDRSDGLGVQAAARA